VWVGGSSTMAHRCVTHLYSSRGGGAFVEEEHGGLSCSPPPLFLRGRVTTCYCSLRSPCRSHQRSLVRFGKGPAAGRSAFLRGRARAWMYHLLLQASVSLGRQGSLEKAVLRTGQPCGAACLFLLSAPCSAGGPFLS
jgi:hypothetical protein